jgi:sigma-B regulation protein RsbU (phosphoserine phosphatase)
MGVLEEFSYATERRRLLPGETLVCFTDGVTEAHSPTQELFGDDRLERTIAAAPDLALDAMLAGIIGAVDQFMSIAPVADDVTLLLLRWLGPA